MPSVKTRTRSSYGTHTDSKRLAIPSSLPHINSPTSMRAEIYTGNPTITTKTPDIDGIWAEYAPRTNLIWLLFLLKTLLKHRKPESPPSVSTRKPLGLCSPNRPAPTGKRGRPKKGAEKCLPISRQVPLTEAQSHTARLKKSLEDRLESVLGLLDLDSGHDDMCCAADLVAFAIDSGWLEEKDFF